MDTNAADHSCFAFCVGLELRVEDSSLGAHEGDDFPEFHGFLGVLWMGFLGVGDVVGNVIVDLDTGTCVRLKGIHRSCQSHHLVVQQVVGSLESSNLLVSLEISCFDLTTSSNIFSCARKAVCFSNALCEGIRFLSFLLFTLFISHSDGHAHGGVEIEFFAVIIIKFGVIGRRPRNVFFSLRGFVLGLIFGAIFDQFRVIGRLRFYSPQFVDGGLFHDFGNEQVPHDVFDHLAFLRVCRHLGLPVQPLHFWQGGSCWSQAHAERAALGRGAARRIQEGGHERRTHGQSLLLLVRSDPRRCLLRLVLGSDWRQSDFLNVFEVFHDITYGVCLESRAKENGRTAI